MYVCCKYTENNNTVFYISVNTFVRTDIPTQSRKAHVISHLAELKLLHTNKKKI